MDKILKGILINLLSASLAFALAPLEIKISSLRYQRYEGQVLAWKIYSQEFQQKNNEIFEAKGVYLENLTKGLRIWAKEAVYYKSEDKFVLKGEVRLLTEREGEVFTEELIFYRKKDLLTAPGKVILKKEGVFVSGEGLIYSLSEGNLQLQKRAKDQFKL